MFFLILLSVLQICFIPGFIVLKFLNNNSRNYGVLLIPVFSFALSLIINYLIVSTLTYFHIYSRSALVTVLIIEFILLLGIFVIKRKRKARNGSCVYKEIKHEINVLVNMRKSVYGFTKLTFLIISGLLIISMSIILILNTGKIFTAWDAVFSWNRWAIDFFNNSIPVSMYHYPQLIPANWSISYVLCGYPLQFIPKSIMPLFLIFLTYSFLVLGIKQKSITFISSILFLFLSFNILNWADGCVDVPVAFFSTMAYICLYLINKESDESDKFRYILLSAIFVCGAAVTKQAGLYMVIMLPLLLTFLTRDKYLWTNKRILKFSGIFLALITIIILPFYIYAEWAIKMGLGASEIKYVTNDIYNGASYFERILNACRLFSDVFSSRIVFILCIYPFLLSFTERNFRLLNLFILIPYLIIWALFYSYDLRNAAIMIPYFCLGIGVGLDIILKKVQTSLLINATIEK